MLREIRNVRQVPGEAHRRWFTSETMDLIVWVHETDGPIQLQLCYDKGRRRTERALSWKRSAGYSHTEVDDGEHGGAFFKASPLLTTDRGFDTGRVGDLFLGNSNYLPSDIVEFVSAKIQAYPHPTPHLSRPHPGASTNAPPGNPG